MHSKLFALIAAFSATTVSAQTIEHRVTPPSAPATLSPAAAAFVARFDADTAAAREKFAHLSDALGVAENLAVRVEVDQLLRKAFPDFAPELSAEDWRSAKDAIWQRIIPIDASNTAYLKSILPADGWFRKSRDGAQVAHDAWLIVQHSPGQTFQREVVARMTPLVQSGEVQGADYALLYDRTEMFAGRPQRYGSQMLCKGGKFVPADMEDPAHVDERRASVGLGTLAQNMERFKGPC